MRCYLMTVVQAIAKAACGMGLGGVMRLNNQFNIIYIMRIYNNDEHEGYSTCFYLKSTCYLDLILILIAKFFDGCLLKLH